MALLMRTLRRLALPLDTYERHALVARLAGRPRTVLDVGGTPGTLALFLPRASITTANLEPPADLLLEGPLLPVGDGSFDVVTSVDVLEHLPEESRAEHVRELVRVAREGVVLCCPLGTPEHVAAERALALWTARETGAAHRFLSEHIERGLPTEDDLRALTEGLPGSWHLYFGGDFRRLHDLFRLGRVARRGARAAARYAVRRLVLRPDLSLSSRSTELTNRAFLAGKLPG